jgi:hypothetical protein
MSRNTLRDAELAQDAADFGASSTSRETPQDESGHVTFRRRRTVTAPNHTDPNFLESLLEAVDLEDQEEDEDDDGSVEEARVLDEDDDETVEEARVLDEARNNQQRVGGGGRGRGRGGRGRGRGGFFVHR